MPKTMTELWHEQQNIDPMYADRVAAIDAKFAKMRDSCNAFATTSNGNGKQDVPSPDETPANTPFEIPYIRLYPKLAIHLRETLKSKDTKQANGRDEAEILYLVWFLITKIISKNPAKYRKTHFDSEWWTWQTVQTWQQLLPHIGSKHTIERALNNLIRGGVLIAKQKKHGNKPRLNWYRISPAYQDELQMLFTNEKQ